MLKKLQNLLESKLAEAKSNFKEADLRFELQDDMTPGYWIELSKIELLEELLLELKDV